MTMFCELDELKNESDVEQKLLMPLLLSERPRGLGYSSVDIRTKPNIKHLLIGKGIQQKRHHPDYVILIAGVPVLIIEAKTPGDDLDSALREARLYASELNSQFPAGLNPCSRLMVTDGRKLVTAPWDSATADGELKFEEIDTSSPRFAPFVDLVSKAWATKQAGATLDLLKKPSFFRPIQLLGGSSVRNEAVGHNTFGATIALEYRHLFSPASDEDRAYIAEKAYVDSPRRNRYMNPLRQLIRAAVPPPVSDLAEVSNSGDSGALIERLRVARSLERQVLLLVGSRGSGKSTFVDRLQAVTLPADVRKSTVWVRMNLNDAPVDRTEIYSWVQARLVDGLRAAEPGIDFDAVDTMNKVYGLELRAFKKGPISLLPETSDAYTIRLVDEIQRLQRDGLATAKAMTRYLCQERGRALVIVMDNCDKGPLAEQLLMFEVAQWAKDQFRCLVFLPIRDVTYDLHRDSPPLDTALKNMVFRIDPPQFSKVLEKRILLAIKEMVAKGGRKLTFMLQNGVQVEYAASDQGMYLISILQSLLEHDRFIRRTITALAGRDVRRAMEIFLEFCNSGHIDEGEIWKIRRASGQHVLPHHVVARVLLRMNRRFYDGEQSYLCNVLQCWPDDRRPDHLVRVAILRWLQQRIREPGPTNVRGYHRCQALLLDLVSLGHDADRVRSEMLYLAQKGCILTEHQSKDKVDDDDLIIISPSGWVHLELLGNIDYVSACAEDLWFGDREAAHRVANRIGSGGVEQHFRKRTLVENANEVYQYLRRYDVKVFRDPDIFLEGSSSRALHDLEEMEKEIQSQMSALGRGKAWQNIGESYTEGMELDGRVTAVKDYGLFVELERGVEGLVHKSKIPVGRGAVDRFRSGDQLRVRILEIKPMEFRMDLELL